MLKKNSIECASFIFHLNAYQATTSCYAPQPQHQQPQQPQQQQQQQ